MTPPAASPAPETVTDAIRFLESEGYDANISIADQSLHCSECGAPYAVGDVVVDYTFRFEGPTDPGDEAIVLGLELPSCGAKGVVVSAYGPDADPELLDVVAALAR